MALDFSQVKAITIPQGSVKSISINGTTVWQEPATKTLVSVTYGSPMIQDFDINATFTPTPLIATYSDGTTAYVQNSATYTGNDTSTVGQHTVYWSYTEGGITKDGSYPIYVRSWETLWSGTAAVSWDTAGSAPSLSVVYSDISLTSGNIRITFTNLSDKIGTYGKYYAAGSEVSDKPTSPLVYNGFDPGSTSNNILTVTGSDPLGAGQKKIEFQWQRIFTYRRFIITSTAPTSGGSDSGTLSMTITKIERQTGGPTRP